MGESYGALYCLGGDNQYRGGEAVYNTRVLLESHVKGTRKENGMMGIKISDLATQIIIIEENQRTAKKIIEEQWSNQWP